MSKKKFFKKVSEKCLHFTHFIQLMCSELFKTNFYKNCNFPTFMQCNKRCVLLFIFRLDKNMKMYSIMDIELALEIYKSVKD